MQHLQIQNISLTELKEVVFEAVSCALKEGYPRLPQPKSSLEFATDALLTKKEASAHLKISLPTLSKYIKKGYLKAHTVAGTRMRFKASELDKALKMLNQSK